mmetsp:Transcript_3655/g.12271  ORF Transcript_3655/g.12271 Transcript_3655/m.12271 type:complete len:269 (+) Transcript_3655:1652-2458(+)
MMISKFLFFDFRSRSIVILAFDLSLSRISKTPAILPSTETHTVVDPFSFERLKASSSSGGNADDFNDDSTNSLVPMTIFFPFTVPKAPNPGSCLKESSAHSYVLLPFCDALLFTATANGCVEFRSTAAARDKTSSSLVKFDVVSFSTVGLPTVRVPVLSKTMTSKSFALSKTSPPRIKRPLRAPNAVPTKTAVGVASPKAHGQATTSTEAASCAAISTGAFTVAADAPNAAATDGKIFVPIVDQNANVAADVAMTPYVKTPEISSASR